MESSNDGQTMYLLSWLYETSANLKCSFSSYSYISSSVNKSKTGTISASSIKDESIIFLKGETINQQVDLEKGTHTALTRPVVLYTPDSKKESSSTTYNGYMNIKNNTVENTDLDPEAVLLKIKKPDGSYLTSIDELNYNEEKHSFDITDKTGIYKFASDYEISATRGNETIHTWEIEIIISDSAVNINKNAGNEINTDISFTKGDYENK